MWLCKNGAPKKVTDGALGGRGIVPLRTPDARFAQSKEASFRFQVDAPTLRCRCVATTRLHPFGKDKNIAARPQGQGTLFQNDGMKYLNVKLS